MGEGSRIMAVVMGAVMAMNMVMVMVQGQQSSTFSSSSSSLSSESKNWTTLLQEAGWDAHDLSVVVKSGPPGKDVKLQLCRLFMPLASAAIDKAFGRPVSASTYLDIKDDVLEGRYNAAQCIESPGFRSSTIVRAVWPGVERMQQNLDAVIGQLNALIKKQSSPTQKP